MIKNLTTGLILTMLAILVLGFAMRLIRMAFVFAPAICLIGVGAYVYFRFKKR